MKKALVLVYSDLLHDARVSRQIRFLSENFEVTAAAYGNNSQTDHQFIPLNPPPLTLWRKFRIAFWSLIGNYSKSWNQFHPINEAIKDLKKQNWDLVVANDIETLPAAFQIKDGSVAKIVLDAHEYSPRQFENLMWWRLIFQPALIWICRVYLKRTEMIFTVGKGIADAYRKNFGCDPVVVTNAPPFREIQPSEISDKKIRIVHHGIANPSRRPDLMFELMQLLDDRFTLDLYLMTSGYASGKTKKYISDLKEKFSSDHRISVHDPLPQDRIVATLNQYDIGLFLLPPVNFNYANALPNKFFDFIQARLAVAIGPSPEMANYLKTFKNGIISESFDPVTLANQLNKLSSEEIKAMKLHSNEAAAQLCAEKNGVIFKETINRIFS